VAKSPKSAKSKGAAPKPYVLVLHGPNLNLLGEREPEIYGSRTLEEIDESLVALGQELGLEVVTFQSNHEGALVDQIQGAKGRVQAILLNAAGYTHTSVAMRDAVLAVQPDVFTIEVHLSNPSAREDFRRKNLLQDVVRGRVEGFGPLSYLLALQAASALIAPRGEL
jgi:3-dehydroquinate dehydratase-2